MTPPGIAPAISVVMAAYNGADLIDATIASVLAQSFTDFELIVVDDKSTDDTLARLRMHTDPRISVIASPANGGPVVARNRGFAQARGALIVGLDQDDLCHPDRFAVQKAFLDAHPATVLVASAVDLLEAGTLRPPRAPPRTSPMLIDWRLQFGNPLVWSSVMFRGGAARALPVFERVDRRYAEDFDLYHRLAPMGEIARIDQPLLTYRIHPGGASQRFTQAMVASATQVLAEPYAALFGDAAQDTAALVLDHFTGGTAVPDAMTMTRINAALAVVHDHFIATRRPGAADRALIIAEYARMWWHMADASVRSGAMARDVVRALCPAGLPSHHPSPGRTAVSAVLGAGRAMLARITP